MTLTVQNLMNTHFISVLETVNAETALKAFSESQLSYIAVHNANNELISLLKRRDLLKYCLSSPIVQDLLQEKNEAHKFRVCFHQPIAECQQHPPVYIEPEASVDRALWLMRKYRTECLIVRVNERILGAVSFYELFPHLQKLSA